MKEVVFIYLEIHKHTHTPTTIQEKEATNVKTSKEILVQGRV